MGKIYISNNFSVAEARVERKFLKEREKRGKRNKTERMTYEN
jgi:hypothetical protein